MPVGVARLAVGVTVAMAVAAGCKAEVEGVPAGAVARIGDEIVEAERLDIAHGRLGGYGQARFRGPEGRRALLDAVVTEALLLRAAREAGLDDDPRVEWAVLEELAELQRAAMLERRLPRAEVAGDLEALRARYQSERARFTDPERRSLRAVPFEDWEAAERAHERLASGELELEALAAELDRQVVQTRAMKRNDREYPGFHSLLFAAVEVDELLAAPVPSGGLVLVGELASIEPARVRGFDEPEVREQLVSAERAARLPAVEAELLAELAARFPVREP